VVALPAGLAAAWLTTLQLGGAGRTGAAVDLVVGGGVFAIIVGLGIWGIGDPALRNVLASVTRRLARRPA
jgi:hypothetical protein